MKGHQEFKKKTDYHKNITIDSSYECEEMLSTYPLS